LENDEENAEERKVRRKENVNYVSGKGKGDEKGRRGSTERKNANYVSGKGKGDEKGRKGSTERKDERSLANVAGR